MPLPVLITQCLQQDFVAPVAPHAPLPNRLHVGHAEAHRLLGRDPAVGPVAELMRWARGRPPEALQVVHIRDWHDPDSPDQHDHLKRFGSHCLAGSEGARLVLDLDHNAGSNEHFVDALTLNDFEGTRLGAVLDALKGQARDGLLRVAVVGVWTEAKVTFLLYDLATRGHIAQLATCSALTASNSRTQHFNALDQLEKILGVQVLSGVGDLVAWLDPPGPGLMAPPARPGVGPSIHADIDGDGASDLTDEDAQLVAGLFREARTVRLHPLTGGFSGAKVYRAESTDAFGHQAAPAVLKLGPRALLSQERVAFEQVEAILGNDAPTVRGFLEHGDRAGLCYAYAAMGQGRVRTFKALYEQGEVDPTPILDEVFGAILDRFYRAARYERIGLLEHYGFQARFAEGVRARVRAVSGSTGDTVTVAGETFTNPGGFYQDALPALLEAERAQPGFHFVSWVHGDLNGANILLDDRDNVWIIDFFHAARGHALKDLLKLENDLLYLFTPLADEDDLAEAVALSTALRQVRDLRAPLPDHRWERPGLQRAWTTLQQIRRHVGRVCQTDRHPTQLSVGLLRYAAHTLSFDEASPLQKQWALAAAAGHAEDVVRGPRKGTPLRVDWIPDGYLPGEGRMGLTLCPGRTDRGRSLEADLAALVDVGATHLVTLCTAEELRWLGVPGLRAAARAVGLRHSHLPIPDQGVPTAAEASALTTTLLHEIRRGGQIVLHCVAGIGRSGTLAACALVTAGLAPDEAISLLRRVRDPRAVESADQERFVRGC